MRATKKIRALVLHRAKKVCFVPAQKSIKSRVKDLSKFLRDVHIHAGGLTRRLFDVTNELLSECDKVRRMRSISSLVRRRQDETVAFETKAGTRADFSFDFGLDKPDKERTA